MDIAGKTIGRLTDHPAVEPRIMPVFPPGDGSALLSMHFLSVLPVGPAPAHWSVKPAESPQGAEQPPEPTEEPPERTEKPEEHRKRHAASSRMEPVTRNQESPPTARVVPPKAESPTVDGEDVMRAEEPTAPDRPGSRDDSQDMKERERESSARRQNDTVVSPAAAVRPVPEPTPAPRARRGAPTHDADEAGIRAVAATHVEAAGRQAAGPQDGHLSSRQTVMRPADPDRRPPRIPRLSGPEKADAPEAHEVSVRIGTVEVRAEPPDRATPPRPRPGPAGFGDYTAVRCYVPGAGGRLRP